MPGLVCNACNVEFPDESSQKLHYRSDWHQYNLRRKVAGVPGVTEGLFNLRLEALAAERKKSEQHLLYKCSICDKEYRSAKAHAQHLGSKLHSLKAAGLSDSSNLEITLTRPAPQKLGQGREQEEKSSEKQFQVKAQKNEDGESSDGWEEVGEDEMIDETLGLGSDQDSGSLCVEDDQGSLSDEELEEWDASQCFFCDLRLDGSIEGCVEHMHKAHGFFIPDSEFLKNPRGLLSYLGLKVTKGFMCLYCNDQGRQFQSIEAVRKHMISKSHCKIRYGDGDDVTEELEEFYDFSSSYSTEGGSQIVGAAATMVPRVTLGTGGSELTIQSDSDNGAQVKILGSREFSRYYRQRPKPSDQRDGVLVNALVSRYRSMGLATRHPVHRIAQMKETKKLPEVRAELMRTKIGLKNNVIRNLPKNVPF